MEYEFRIACLDGEHGFGNTGQTGTITVTANTVKQAKKKVARELPGG